MFRLALVSVTTILLCGCVSGTHSRSMFDQQMFGPAAIRIHPTFTQPRDWTGGGKLDGIEATLEIEDQFGEPTRSTGRAMFELYEYRKDTPRLRGNRIGNPWIFHLNARSEQQEHWNSALRAYTFQLPFPGVKTNRYYVLDVQFDLNADAAARPGTMPSSMPSTVPATRLFDQLIIEPQTGEKSHGRYRAPSINPGH